MTNKFLIIFIISLSILLPLTSRDQLGDVNDDGQVNILDIVMIVQFLLYPENIPTDYEFWAMDANGDDSLDVTDIVLIVNYIVGTGILCPPGYSFCEGTTSECCADISSHETQWDINLIGNENELNWLLDVAIVSDSSFIAVGYITIDDNNYNYAYWDGNNWNYELIHVNWELTGIKYFSENNIWVCMDIPIHWDGDSWNVYHLWDMGILEEGDSGVKKIWGKSPTVVYFIGDHGTLVKYDINGFSKLNTYTDSDLISISGVESNDVWISGNGLSSGNRNSILIHYDGSILQSHINGELPEYPDPYNVTGVLESIYTDKSDSLWIKTDFGIYKVSSQNPSAGENLTFQYDWVFASEHLSGVTNNDIYIIGSLSALWHYNGDSVYFFNEVFAGFRFRSVASNLSKAVVVGRNPASSQCLVLYGVR